MIGYRINNIKGVFFDSAKVQAATSRAERRVLSRFGAYVRRSARSSIRKRKRPAAIGSPPSSHTGHLKKFIFFAYDVRRQSVVIGPVRLNNKPGDAPAALEYGGRSHVIRRNRRGRRHPQRVSVGGRLPRHAIRPRPGSRRPPPPRRHPTRFAHRGAHLHLPLAHLPHSPTPLSPGPGRL